MKKEALKILFQHAVRYSKYSRLRRLIQTPFRTISKFLLFRLTEGFKTTMLVKGKLFFNQKMYMVLPDPVSVFLSNFGFFEEGLTCFVIDYLNEGDIFVDVGAHFGYYTLLSSAIVGVNGEVHSFEPTPTVFRILEKNGCHDNITNNNLALSDQRSIKDFYDAGLKLSAFNSFSVPNLEELKGNKKKASLKKMRVSCTTLDEYFSNRERLPDFVKIDAENAELEVLKGMKIIIKVKHPLITLETGDHGSDLSKDKIQYLINLGYRPFEYSNGRIREHVIKEEYGYDNLLFI